MSQKNLGIKIISACRTPIGALGGQLRAVPSHILGSRALSHAGALAEIEPAKVSHIFTGSIFSAGTGPNPAQRAATEAGLGEEVLCANIKAGGGSALIALLNAAAMLEDDQFSLIAGMDSASTQPYLLPGARSGSRLGGGKLVDGAFADAFTGEDDVPLNVTTALQARNLEITEEDQKALVAEKRAAQSDEKERFAPVEVFRRRTVEQVKEDERPLPAPTPFLAGMADAAAACVLSHNGVGPQLVGWARDGVYPNRTPLAPVAATKALLQKLGKEASDLAILEIDESLGLASLIVEKELGLARTIVNPYGGALSRGYPGAACGAIALYNLTKFLRIKGGLGIVSYATGAGGAISLAFSFDG
jgi:acetyl-CoA C-acetyltransferase